MPTADERDPRHAEYLRLREQALGVAAVNAAFLAMEQAWDAWMDEEQVRHRALLLGEPVGALADSCAARRAAWEAAAGTLRALLTLQVAQPVQLPRPTRRVAGADLWGDSSPWG